jgi:antitoxin ParD1/3/4
MDFFVTLNIYRSLCGSTHGPCHVFLLHGGPIAAAPYPLHAAGGGPHVTDGAGHTGKQGVWEGVATIDKLCQRRQPFAMATMNISLPEPMKSYVESQTLDGRYANVSDYMRDLIRRDQARQTALAEIQSLVDEAVASGPSTPFDMQSFLATRERL